VPLQSLARLASCPVVSLFPFLGLFTLMFPQDHRSSTRWDLSFIPGFSFLLFSISKSISSFCFTNMLDSNFNTWLYLFYVSLFSKIFLYVKAFLGRYKKLQYRPSNCQKSHILKLEARCTWSSVKDPLKLQQTWAICVRPGRPIINTIGQHEGSSRVSESMDMSSLSDDWRFLLDTARNYGCVNEVLDQPTVNRILHNCVGCLSSCLICLTSITLHINY
jgi:hypothetical protein